MSTIRLTTLGEGRIDVPKLKPEQIIIRKDFNYRDTTSPEARAHIEWLKASIRENGIEKPLEVEFDAGKVYLVDGECRLIAARELVKEKIEVKVPVIQVRGDEATILAKAMTANGGLPPSAIEFGKAAQRLRAYGWNDEQIAAIVPPHIRVKGLKYSKRFVNDAVDLHNAPLAVKDAVKNGINGVKVSPAAALSAVRKSGSKAADVLKERAASAKSKGKTEVSREKAEGTLTAVGDRLAALVLMETWDAAKIMETARQWQVARKG